MDTKKATITIFATEPTAHIPGFETEANRDSHGVYLRGFPSLAGLIGQSLAQKNMFSTGRNCLFPPSYTGSKTACLLKGHGNEAEFLGILQKLVPHESLTLPFRPFRFWLRIRGDIHIRKTTPSYLRCGESRTLRIVDTGSLRLPVSLSRGVNDSPHHWYAESVTPRITDTESRLLHFLEENSLYRWYGELSTPRTSDTVSRRLSVSLSRRVADSAYHR